VLRKSYGFAGRREDASRSRAEARKEAGKWHEGKAGKEELARGVPSCLIGKDSLSAICDP